MSALTDIAFLTPDQGWGLYAGSILSTADAGRTWAIRFNTRSVWAWGDGGPALTRCRSSMLITAAVGSAGMIVVTADGGNTWCWQVSGVTSGLRGVKFFDREHGWAADDREVWATTDDGTTWQRQSRHS